MAKAVSASATRTHSVRWMLTGMFTMLQLSGCVSLAPNYQQPPLPVTASYDSADLAASTQGPSSALPQWRSYFTDPGLQEVIAQALVNNRDLRVAFARVNQARAAYGIESAAQFPTVSAQAEMTRSRVPADLNLTRRAVLGNQYQVGLGLASWELDFWGRVRSLSDAALENFLATESAHRAVRLDLIGQVAATYLALCELNERLALAQKALDSRQESYRIFSRRLDVGATSRFNLRQVEVLLTQAQALVAQLQQERAAQLHRLDLLVGAPIAAPLQLRQLSALNSLSQLPAQSPSDLLTQRPDIVAAEHKLKAANANIGAARAAFFPRIALTGSGGSASAELNNLFASGSQAWTFSPTISLPLFDGGLRRNNLSLSQARRDEALNAYEKAIQSAFRDVADALSAHRWLSQQVAVAQTALSAQADRARLSRLRYDNGAAAFLEVLDAERDLLTTEQQVVQLKRALASSAVSLYAALGGSMQTLPEPTDDQTISDKTP